ncbi:hypothetical protein C8Q76DRAFT_627105, partial [Earliella scabrosa]
LELAQTGTTTHNAWYYAIENWNNPMVLFTFTWSAISIPITDGVIALIAQIFYAWRIWTLSRANRIFKFMAVLVVLLAITQAVAALTAAIIVSEASLDGGNSMLIEPFALWIITSFVADVLVAASMLWLLYTVKHRTVWEKSINTIGKLMVITLGTGTALALCGVLALALYSSSPSTSFQYVPA